MKTLLRALAGVLIALAAITLIGAPAYAAGPVVATSMAFAFTLDPLTLVQFVTAFIMPVLVGLVTTRVTSGARKAWLLAGLTLASSLLFELARSLQDATTFDLGVALTGALPAFVVSVAGYYGLWKPTGVTTAAQNVGTIPVATAAGTERMTRAQYRRAIAAGTLEQKPEVGRG